MAVQAGQTFAQTSATQLIDTILTQEAHRIGKDIHQFTLHVSPWIDLVKQTSFPEGMGYTLGTLIYDRSLPIRVDSQGAVQGLGLNWGGISGNVQDGQIVTGSTLDQIIPGTYDTFNGPDGSGIKSRIQFTRKFKQYTLERAVVESPRINVEDLRFAVYRTEQLRAVMDALTRSTRNAWENRYRDEYDKVCANVSICKTADTVVSMNVAEGQSTLSYVNGQDPFAYPTANISNKILDSIYFRLVREGAGTQAYGRENARPVFALVCSSEVSYALQTEAEFRDDIRYNNSKVSELIAPLGVEKSFRGYYHLVDDHAPRFDLNEAETALVRVEDHKIDANGAVVLNDAYETAQFEIAYVLHKEVMESQIPEPITGSNGLKFDPVNYRGQFSWKNIPSNDLNPDGTIGFFRGILASATKPIKTEYGYAILFDRKSTDPAA